MPPDCPQPPPFSVVIIRSKSFPRAGLVGNPSDGYFGKTISFIIRDFESEVILYETPELKILPSRRDLSVFDDIEKLAHDVESYGYYGGIRLLKATIKRFHDHCVEHGISLARENFTIRYTSNVPDHVGLAGSSAIITAGLRALMEFYDVKIDPAIQANLVLSVEKDELGIPAGLQDRVIQAYEGVVFMDFDRKYFEPDARGYGSYEVIDPSLLPPVYVAYATDLREGTEVFHNDIRARFERGDKEVVDAMEEWAGLAQQVHDLLVDGRGKEIGPYLDENFDLRRRIYRISDGNLRVIEAARAAGASAKFTGSGGAIVGTYEGDAMFANLKGALEALGMSVFKPVIEAPAAARAVVEERVALGRIDS